MFGIADDIKSLLISSMDKWKTVLRSNEQVLGEVEIKRGIFQGDTLSHLLFVLALIPLSMTLKVTDYGYQLEKRGLKINHLLFMDDLKLYGKTERELNSLIHIVRIFSEDIGMKFGMDKCSFVVLKQEKIGSTNSIELPDGYQMVKQ